MVVLLQNMKRIPVITGGLSRTVTSYLCIPANVFYFSIANKLFYIDHENKDC